MGRMVLTESDSAWKSSGTVACRIDIEVRLLRVVMKSSFTVLSFFRCATSFFAVCGAFSSSEKSMFHLGQRAVRGERGVGGGEANSPRDFEAAAVQIVASLRAARLELSGQLPQSIFELPRRLGRGGQFGQREDPSLLRRRHRIIALVDRARGEGVNKRRRDFDEVARFDKLRRVGGLSPRPVGLPRRDSLGGDTRERSLGGGAPPRRRR